ncbi:MAG: hypothetical protein PUB60_08245, partial [Veillonellaceae bacterium]|nr:hypothetical protein [Veillonellaceae bacterium]
METLVLTSHGNILQIGEGVVKDFFLARGNFLDKPPYIYFRFLTHTPFFAVFQNNKIASCWDSSTSRVRSRRPERFARTA